METDLKKLWENTLNIIKGEMSEVSFNTWIKSCEPISISSNTIKISVPNVFTQDILEKRYKDLVINSIYSACSKQYNVEFLTESEIQEANSDKPTDSSEQNHKDSMSITVSDEMSSTLNPKYTFDSFVIGNSNRFAHAASLAVAESPAKAYNPLFIYGGVGLGKTHLMHSIAHFILDKNPKKKVLYVTSETFTNELIDALRNGKTAGNESAMLNFRDKYRNIDVLLIDDIQFIIGKESTQEEFFHTFNHLHTLGKQIIISSDKPPKDIETLESRLRTRFEWGLIADISSPDYETRMAILQKKIELDHLEKYNIKNDVLDYIAANVKSNIRELEGSLNKLIALYKLNNNNNPIDIALAAEALKDIISSDNRREVTPELILDIVADHFGITVADLKSKKRDSEIAVPRQICMYLMRTMTDTALKGIGAVLGGKDHSTVKYGVEKIAKDIESDEMMANTINIIKKKINPA